MSKDRENAIKILSHLSPSIREAIAVYIRTTPGLSDVGKGIANTIARDVQAAYDAE